jgi:hypothetical protein
LRSLPGRGAKRLERRQKNSHLQQVAVSSSLA